MVMARQRIELASAEAAELSPRARATTVSVRDRRRAEIILLSARGLTQQRIAEQLGISRLAVNRWVGRFSLHRLDGLNDRTGRGRKPWLPQAAVQQVVEQAVTPPPHLGRWSCRTMARAAGISPASVQRLWAASDIKPHLSRTFKLSNDKRFEEKFWDVIGLYLNPPDKALVLCCDEKSQCQALERTQPGLPLGIGHIRTKTHDYVRHGTLTLFAALNYLEGKLITRLAARHRHQEWLAFLKTIDEETPAELDIHIIADNYATHKHPVVTRWLDRHAPSSLPRKASPRPENWPMPSSLSWRRVTKIRGATCGRPKVKTSCARSTPPDRRSPPSSPTVTLFQRRNTSAPEMASRCYPARYAQGGGSPQCAATEEPYLRHTSLDRNRCWRHTRQWHLVMPSLPEMRVERDWRSSAA